MQAPHFYYIIHHCLSLCATLGDTQGNALCKAQFTTESNYEDHWCLDKIVICWPYGEYCHQQQDKWSPERENTGLVDEWHKRQSYQELRKQVVMKQHGCLHNKAWHCCWWKHSWWSSAKYLMYNFGHRDINLRPEPVTPVRKFKTISLNWIKWYWTKLMA